MAGYVATLELSLHIPEARSLKAKRSVVKPVVEGLRRRFQVSVAEVDYQDLWQRADLLVAVAGSSATHVEEVLDACERFVWSHPDLDVLEVTRRDA
jgi:uncharacterized protein YlxP (DUF503 family)